MEKLIVNEKGELTFEVWQKGQLIKTLTPIEKGLWRSKEFCYIFTRVALNPISLKNISAPFLQKILYRVPNREGFDFHYFTWQKEISLPHIHVLDPKLGRLCGLCFSVGVVNKKYVKKSAQPKRLSKEQAQKILHDKVYEGIPCLGSFTESGETYVAPKQE